MDNAISEAVTNTDERAPGAVKPDFARCRRKLCVNGITMNVLIAGEGPDVLLVHGFPDTHAVWRKQIPVLVESGYRVIVPDTRGCGESSLMPAVKDYHIDALVADLVALLDELGIDKVRLVAHDWGAGISWQLVARHPQRVDRYVALSTGHPSAYVRGGWAQKLKGYYTFLFQLPGFPEWMLRACNWLAFRVLTGYPQEQAQWRSALSRPGRLAAGINYYRANRQLFLGAGAPHVTVPVMGVWSSGDRFLAEGQLRDSGRYVDASYRFERIEGANHWLQLSAAEQFNPLLLEFLE